MKSSNIIISLILGVAIVLSGCKSKSDKSAYVPPTATGIQMGTPHQDQGQGQGQVFHMVEPVNREKLEVVKKVVSLGELLSAPTEYGDKLVKISGKVTKVNNAIMGTNWAHITSKINDANNYDLTITTHETVQVGDIVTFEGKITLKKDFGSGYSYDILMEDGVLVSN
ncbi:MAG: hypothetical protein J7L96_07395 [Bacteroidales bacterium]|nr:hypothetical protein [Bacteroidales bacterium]